MSNENWFYYDQDASEIKFSTWKNNLEIIREIKLDGFKLI